MTRSIFLACLVTWATGLPLAAAGAPYEDQKIWIHRVQEAKLRGAAPASSACADMERSAPLMKEMRQQMSRIDAVEQMTAEQMRSWIKEHAALMERMHREMHRH